MKGSGAVLALLWLCGCPPSHQQQHYHQPPQQHQRPPAEKPSVRRVNAALDVPPAQRIPSDLVLKDGSTLERTYVGGTHHWNDPVVHTWENVLSPEECQQIIDLAKPGLMRANVSDDSRGHTSDSRTNDNSWLSHDRSPLTWALVERIAAIVGVPPTHAESIQVIHYEVGEFYHNHYDAYEHDTINGDKKMRDGGNRVITALVYLNDPEEGGETDLVNLGLKIMPATGKLLVFHDCYNGSATKHPDSYHAGRPPKKGEKWAFNLWFHEGPTQAGYAATQSKLYAEGKAGPSIRDLMTHVAKKFQERQEQEEASGTKMLEKEPTEEEKQMLQEKLEKFFVANTPGTFKRKQAQAPRQIAPDPTGVEAIQAAIKTLRDNKQKAEASTAPASAADTTTENAVVQPEPRLEQTDKPKLSRRQRVAAAKKLKLADDENNLATAQPVDVSALDEIAAMITGSEGVTVDGLTLSEHELTELQVLRQAVVDAQARLDAFLQAHSSVAKTAKEDGGRAKDRMANTPSCVVDTEDGEQMSDKEARGTGDSSSTTGPMTRLINTATEQLERKRKYEGSVEDEKAMAPNKSKRKTGFSTKEDILNALHQLKNERGTSSDNTKS